MLAFAYARSHLTNGAKVEGMLGLWEGYNKGQRGYNCELSRFSKFLLSLPVFAAD